MKIRQLASTHRARLVVAFILISVLTATVTAGITVLRARDVVLTQTQDSAVATLRAAVEKVAPDLRAPLAQPELGLLVQQLAPSNGEQSGATQFAASQDGEVVGGATGQLPSSDLVRAATESTTTLAQTVSQDGASYLAVAMPVLTSVDATASGVVVYSFTPLAAQEAVIGDITTGAVLSALPVVVLAILLALLLARSLLGPVRRLQAGVHELSTGRLGVQIPLVDRGEFGELTTSFNAMSRELEKERNELRDMEERSRRFTADVSHELRTPLAAMSAVAGLLTEDAKRLPSDTAEAALLVAQETRSLARLVDDLIDISRFDAGTARLELDEIDLGRLMERTLAIRDWRDRVTVDVPEGLRVRVDPRRVDVILANLVGNAVRHAGDDAAIAISARTEETDVVITVTDDGPGIPTELRSRIFDRFVKGDPTRTRSDGSGLGLSIARENAGLHGGFLTLEENGAPGTTFVLRLPAASENHSDSA